MKTRAFLFTALLASGLLFTACSTEETTPSTEMTDTAAAPAPAPATPSADTAVAPAPAPMDTAAASSSATSDTATTADTTKK